MSEDAGAAAQGNPGAQGGQESATGPDGAQGAAGGATQAPATAGANGNGSGGSDDDAAELLATMAAAGDGDGDQDKPDASKELEHWKSMSRKNEQRARANASAARELEEIKRSQMSEQERLQAERDQYKEEAANNAAQLNRVMAAAAYDLPPELIEHLGGGTEEEISGRAEAFAAAINQRATELAAAVVPQNGQGDGQEQGAQPQPQQPANPFFRSRVPVESLRPGAAPAGDNVARNSNDMFRDMLQRRS